MAHPAWWLVNGDLDQQGPGSDASTLRALETLAELPSTPRIADMGCGPGRQTLALARATGGHIAALDLLPPFLKRLRTRAEGAGLADRIALVQSDMARPPFAASSFDLIWSEGAVYNVGFEAGLARWGELLRPGGLAAVTELSWIGEPPTETLAFWQGHYPEMADVEANCKRAERAGYRVLDHFALPHSDWRAYYDPIEARAAKLRPRYADDPRALAAIGHQDHEIEIFEGSRGSYSYVFYLLRKD
ncbi:MAG: methyltransferase domain-containing protein [Deltaproteobacteria bacterium]|nr:methyltransferase domain-containing protein [Deltaproteobacteria bacterium]MBW2359647.1 methyltransferase domain-containing protein [Deltaproteobacteria bacterium]